MKIEDSVGFRGPPTATSSTWFQAGCILQTKNCNKYDTCKSKLCQSITGITKIHFLTIQSSGMMTAIAHNKTTVSHAIAMSAIGSPSANSKLIPLLIIEVRALVICKNGQIRINCNKIPASAPDLVRSDTIRCKAEAATL